MVEENGQTVPDIQELSDFRTLNPLSKNAMYLGNLIVLAIPVAITVALGLYLKSYTDFRFLAMLALAAIVVVYELVSPPIFYKYYRYRMDDDCIEVRSGVIFRAHTLVPVERIHQVEVKKGPILRKYGLATVTMTTAGGTVSLEYLDEPIAEEIAQHLNEKIIKMLKARQ